MYYTVSVNIVLNSRGWGVVMKKFITSLALALSLGVATQANAVVVVPLTWESQFIAAIVFDGLQYESSTVTDVSLRNVCIHAMGGDYFSFAEGEVAPLTTIPVPKSGHLCRTVGDANADKGATAFEKLCVNKLKLGYEPLLNTQDGNFYFCR